MKMLRTTLNVRLLTLTLLLATIPAFAQQAASSTSNATQAQSAPVPDGPQPQSAEPREPTAPNKRLFGIIPQNKISDVSHFTALTPRQKFRLFAYDSVEPFGVFVTAVSAGASQASNSFEGYGQGAKGYAKRFGAGLADNTSGEFFGTFVYATAFKEDPRYFRLGHGSIGKRTMNAVKSSVWGFTDSGKQRFSFSHVLGNITAGTLSNAYYPDNDRGLGLTFQRAGYITVINALGNIGNEFLPDIQRWWTNRHNNGKH